MDLVSSFHHLSSIELGVFIMVVITRKKGETKDSLFRKFTRSFIEEDVVSEVRKKLFYKKPSLRRKEDEKERLKHISRMKKRIPFQRKTRFFRSY